MSGEEIGPIGLADKVGGVLVKCTPNIREHIVKGNCGVLENRTQLNASGH